ncbi:Alpha/Beta hydrolase protein [Mucor mucedo]|uniref:Alpha/Beta hydrolase protein n=1 Tax=Mucor mucedo TaxID=29922 RepID=UPI002221216B|nr:Alpha/Beta hydrolase protein [Mucor mucedo]KAI7895684.1 Alpha/Beta hydrolase protein [Mucor mucedo]
MAQTDAEFNLPYNPTRVIKINIATFSIIFGWVTYLPIIVSYLYWRYWELGTRRFKEIVSVDIPYSEHSKLDVYHPTKKMIHGSPIIIFVYGGAWSSGSKLIYTTLANTLRELGYVVVVPDYRKYPQVKIEGMYQDIRDAIKWTHRHAADINGDPELIFIMGHSAGAQLTAQVVLSDIIEQAKYNESIQSRESPYVSQKHDPSMKMQGNEGHMISDSNQYQPRDFLPLVEGILLFSGIYDIGAHLVHETSRGVEKVSAMSRAMGSSTEGYLKNSPLHLIEKNEKLFSDSDDLLDLWPRILLLHGQKDGTVGMDQSANMFNTLGKLFSSERRQELDVRMRLYKRMAHEEPVISLMLNKFAKKNDQNLLLKDIQEFIDLPQDES